MEKKWFLYHEKQRTGPHAWEELYSKAASGGIDPQDLVWAEGMPEWTRADQVDGLLQKTVPPPPSGGPPPFPASPPHIHASPAGPATETGHQSSLTSKTSTGLEPNIAALLSYILGWITGIIFLLLEKDNKFVRFHAMQSTIFSGAITVIQIFLSIVSTLIWSIVWRGGISTWNTASAITGFLSILSLLFWLACIALVILAMVKSYNHELYKLPIAGKIAEKQLY